MSKFLILEVVYQTFPFQLTPSRKGASEPPEDAESVLGDPFSEAQSVRTDRKVDQLTEC